MAKIHYHISSKDLGKQVSLKPKIPRSALREEGLKPRVCFCPTLEECLHSISGIREGQLYIAEVIYEQICPALLNNNSANMARVINPTIYKTQRKLILPPQNISDFATFRERWSLSDIMVDRIGYIDLHYLLFNQKIKITNKSKPRFTDKEIIVFFRTRRACQVTLKLQP